MRIIKKFGRPISAVPNEDKSIFLRFDFDEEECRYPEGEFDIRGGVCWPITYQINGTLESGGHILVAGKNLDSGVVTIFEQQEFMFVEPIINRETQLIEFPGISNFLNNAYANYYCRKYYWHQDPETAKQHRIEITRSQMIKPKPALIEVPWGDGSSDAGHIIWKFVKANRLQYKKGSELHKQLELTKIDTKQMYPATHALQCALMGMSRFPFRRRVPDLHSPVSVDAAFFR